MTENNPNAGLLHHVDAVIFDMDGLMLDSERLHLDHFRISADHFGYPALEDVYFQSVGLNSRDTEKLFIRNFGDAFPYEAIREHWRIGIENHVAQFGVPHKPGLAELLASPQLRKLPKAVATSTRRGNAVELLEKVKLLHHFNSVVGGDEVPVGKPAPDIFLKAAQRLHVAPSRCVVFEDSPAGLRGAHAAGMIPILIPDLIEPPPDVRAMAWRVLSSLDQAIGLFAEHVWE